MADEPSFERRREAVTKVEKLKMEEQRLLAEVVEAIVPRAARDPIAPTTRR